MSLFRFFSSLTFALILIALTAIFVMIGTFLESNTSSHALAEDWIYHHPVFYSMLAGFFINILFSALRRWPFENKHIPFLITHLGLLMVISGVFIKSIKGTQGHIFLVEGTATDTLVLPHQKAIWIEQKSPRTNYSIPLHYSFWSGWTLDAPQTLSLKLVSYHPHAEEKYVGWLNQTGITLYGFPALPLEPTPLESHHLTISGSYGEPIETALEEIQKRKDQAFLHLHQDEDLNPTLVAGDPYGLFFTEHFNADHLDRWIAYDDGFLGYSLQIKVPIIMRQNNLIEQLRKHLDFTFSSPLELFRKASQACKQDFPTSFVTYLKEWADQGTWLFSSPSPSSYSLLSQVDWKSIPSGEFKALYWIASLLEESHFLEHLKKKQWPLLRSLEELASSSLNEKEKKEAVFLTWMHQLYEAKDSLPAPPAGSLSPDLTSRMLSAFLRLYGIDFSDLPLTPEKFLTLETPLRRAITPASPPLKQENAKPLAVVKWKDHTIPLVFDAQGTRLKWPSGDGNTLLRYQNHRVTLPYEIRLHHAKDIKYPGSQQTLSYECLLSIRNQATQQVTPCTLKMNQVHETPEGFRLYLSGMGTIDSLGVHSVQLVVNRDPAKYWLTYPGGLLVAAGIMLLFWQRKN